MIGLGRKQSTELPLWARIIFETPELLEEILKKFNTRMHKSI
jgi:hypothetical protein